MAKAYYFNYIPVSDASQCSEDEAARICTQMIQIVIAAFQEYGLYVKDNNYFSCRQGKKLLSDETCFCCVYPDKLGAAWDHSTWDYNRDKSGEIFVVFKKDNKLVVSFGANKIAKENTNEEIISRIREKAVDAGVLSEESAIFETEARIVEKFKRSDTEKTKSNDVEKLKSSDTEKTKSNDVEKLKGSDIEKTISSKNTPIQKYASTNVYGYGFIEVYSYASGPTSYSYKYSEHITIKGGSNSSTRFDMGMKPITLKRKYPSGNFKDEKQPIYLVEDDGVWKEYFTGIEVKCLEKPFIDGYFSGFHEYDVNHDKSKGIREFSFVFEEIWLMGAQDFANMISRYSDTEIKDMVRQFIKLKENAATWGAKFDKAVEVVKKDHDLKNEMALSKLEDRMGKYANAGDNEEKKSGNGIIVFLIIALIIVFLLWIVK